MKFTSLGIAILLTAASLALAQDPAATPAAAPEEEIVITAADGQGEAEVDFATGEATARNGVIIRYRDTTLRARRVRIDQATQNLWAEGDVQIERRDETGDVQLWRGESARYNYVTKAVEAAEFRGGQPPFFVAGKELRGAENADQTATEAIITTEDYANPAYRVRARRLTVTADRRIVAKDAVMYLGGVPVMYFPTYTAHTGERSNYWKLEPGYWSRFGAFLDTTYHHAWNSSLTTSLHLDYRTERGAGVGPEVTYDLGDWGQGNAMFYYAHDEEPPLDAYGRLMDPDRTRAKLTHIMSPWEDFQAKAVLRYWGDAEFEREFFQNEFRADRQPKSFLEVSQFWRNFSLSAVAQPQVNDYYQTIERLPDVKLTGLRQQLGSSPLYYESESSLAYLRFREAPLGPGTDYEASRADTYHQIVLPWTFFGWLNLTPRVGGRFTHYGEADDLGLDERSRSVFNTGAELSTKASRVWPNARNRLLDVEGIRHIIEPSVNYVWVPEPDARPFEIPRFDDTSPTYRLLPIEFPDYNSIDSIDTQNVLRFGLRNKVQTKRDGRVENLANWALYTDWRLNPLQGQSTFPDFYSDLDFQPRSWILLTSELRYNPAGEHFREANHRLTLLPDDRWNWTLGNRYLRDDPATYGPGNNVYYTALVFRMNENWAFRTSQHFEARDGTLEEHYYTLYRDLRSWTAALTLRFRDNRQNGDDWALSLSFQLKAMPRRKLGQDSERAEYLMGE